MRLIDADALIEYIDVGHLRNPLELCFSERAVVDMLERRPTVDAVPVVRCKDCKQWRRNIGFTDSPNGHCFYIDMDTNQYDFCSFGERRATNEAD